MRSNPFESQLERLARTLTEEFGVKVVCQGDQALTDGSTIVLPSLPEPMSSSLERMVVGYLDHEMAHVAFSDFKVVKKFNTRHPGHEGMLNVVEDALIERRAMKRWPGVRANLDAMFAQIHDRVKASLDQRDPFDRFCTAVYLKLSHHQEMFGLEPEIAGYEDLFDRFPAVRNTRDSAALSEQILERWLRAQPRSPNSQTGSGETSGEERESAPDSSPDSSESPSGNRDRTGAEGESEDSESPPSESDEGTESDGTPSEKDRSSPNQEQFPETTSDSGDRKSDDGPAGSSHQTAPDGERSSGEERSSSQDPKTAEDDAANEDDSPAQVASGGYGGSLIGEALAEAIAECVAQVDTSTEYRVFTKEHDVIEVLPFADERDVRRLLQDSIDTVRRLRRGLANALRSAEKRWWREDQTRGSLSPRTLHRLCMDRPRLDIFRTRSMVQGRSTAVCIVLDASGSMTSRKMAVARDAMRVLLEALDDLAIATEAFTFTTGHAFDLHLAANASGEDMAKLLERFSRFANLQIGVIKRFEEPVKAALCRLPEVRGTGLTPLGEAMAVGARRLVSRRESRKVMLVLTDGKAGCEGSSPAASHHAQHVASLITKSGIELVGVGIMDESVREIVEDAIVVHELEDLPAQLSKLLGRTLKKGLCHVG